MINLHESNLSIICSFLETADKVRLGSTCTTMRSHCLTNIFWPSITIQDHYTNFRHRLVWFGKHRHSISPKALEIILREKQTKLLIMALEWLLDGFPTVTEVYVDVAKKFQEDSEYQVATTALFKAVLMKTGVKSLTTTYFPENDSLPLEHLQRLYLIGQHWQFTGLSLMSLPPLKSLVIKPHQLSFSTLTEYIVKSGKTIEQLEIDCQNYPIDKFMKMIVCLNRAILTKLRLYHLQNMSSECIKSLMNTPNLRQLVLTKAYQIPDDIFRELFTSSPWANLVHLDISQSNQIEDYSLLQLFGKSRKMKIIKLAWCNKITSTVVNFIVEKCLEVQELILTGLKLLNDDGFRVLPFHLYLKHKFNEVKKEGANYPIQYFFTEYVHIKQLRHLKMLDCVSCDYVSNQLLEMISIICPQSIVLDYFSQRIGLKEFDEFI